MHMHIILRTCIKTYQHICHEPNSLTIKNCQKPLPVQRETKSRCRRARSEPLKFENSSCAARESERNLASNSRMRGCTSSARSFNPASDKPASVRTLERATYPCPYSNALERSMCAASSDIPWLL